MGRRERMQVLDWNEVYLACKQVYADRFEDFDDGPWTGNCWRGSVIFRQERIDGEPPLKDGEGFEGHGKIAPPAPERDT